MIALDYECLIRSAFRCKRTFRHGADADLYRGLEHCVKPFPGVKTGDYEIGVIVGEITAYLYEAFYELTERHEDNKALQSAIRECLTLLEEPSPEKINECIVKGREALKIAGLEVNIEY